MINAKIMLCDPIGRMIIDVHKQRRLYALTPCVITKGLAQGMAAEDVIIGENDSAYEFALAPGEALTFWVNGKMSISDQWKSGDLGLSVTCCLEAAGSFE